MYAQPKVTDYLGVQKPLTFQNKAYNLAWSSHPTASYYKQEYLQKGESLEQFRSMILLEVLSGSARLADIVNAKVNELNTMKKTNPVVRYEMFNKKETGEYLLDFVLSANNPDGSIAIVERNVYRYKTLGSKGGILLFGVSTRSYGKEAAAFLTALKNNRKTLVNDVAQFALPQVRL